jgi:hypothetical protein
MSLRVVRVTGLIAVVACVTACETTKSSNPLSPTVAGPIPGVVISSPAVVQPTAGARIAVDQQPITLQVQNATTSGVRPLTYVFEVAMDVGFTNRVFMRDKIAPGDGGRTSLTLPNPLATSHTYYWRAHAEDGANTGSPSASTTFDVFTPIVINAPVLVSPAPNSTVDSIRPKFTVTDATRSGPVGAISYVIEIADSNSFANKIATWTSGEQPNQTVFQMPSDLAYSMVYYWHVRAYDPTTNGPFSTTWAFVTPSAPPPPAPGPSPGPSPSPSPGSPAGNDALNLGLAAVYNSPADIASWPATGTITRLDMSGSAGLSFQFTTQQSWPDVVPPGFAGPLEYTVWAVVNINGQWNTAGFIQMWRGRPSTGAPILTNFATNWAYDSRWGPMAGYQPHVGEQMGFFLSAGNARGASGVSSVRERTNVVMVALPPGDSGSFTFSLARIMSRPRR